MELAMEPGALKFEWLKKLSEEDAKKFTRPFSSIREDGAYVDAGENDNLIVQKLGANPGALGIFGFSYLDQNTDKIQGAAVDGAQPTFELIANGKYPLSRPLFIYVKKAHAGVIPGVKEYLAEFTQRKGLGQGRLPERKRPHPPAGCRTQAGGGKREGDEDPHRGEISSAYFSKVRPEPVGLGLTCFKMNLYLS